jgi:hypothetical protein
MSFPYIVATANFASQHGTCEENNEERGHFLYESMKIAFSSRPHHHSRA